MGARLSPGGGSAWRPRTHPGTRPAAPGLAARLASGSTARVVFSPTDKAAAAAAWDAWCRAHQRSEYAGLLDAAVSDDT